MTQPDGGARGGLDPADQVPAGRRDSKASPTLATVPAIGLIPLLLAREFL